MGWAEWLTNPINKSKGYTKDHVGKPGYWVNRDLYPNNELGLTTDILSRARMGRDMAGIFGSGRMAADNYKDGYTEEQVNRAKAAELFGTTEDFFGNWHHGGEYMDTSDQHYVPGIPDMIARGGYDNITGGPGFWGYKGTRGYAQDVGRPDSDYVDTTLPLKPSAYITGRPKVLSQMPPMTTGSNANVSLASPFVPSYKPLKPPQIRAPLSLDAGVNF